MAILVNGERIDDETIRQQAEGMRPEFEKAFADESPAQREPRLQEWARENTVEAVLLAQAARADTEPLQPERVEVAVAALCRQAGHTRTEEEVRTEVDLDLRLDRLLEGVIKALPAPTDEAVAAYYAEHKPQFVAPERARAAHIVKNVTVAVPPEVAEAELRKAQADLAAGADFAQTAARYSDCPENGGDLGWFPRGQMVKEFDNAVWAMQPGQTSEIFATRFGFHIVRLIERKTRTPYALEEVADEIRRRLAAEAGQAAVEAFIDRLREKATIEEA
ncbi:MAG TPA: peptidylprolyl isomerase [Phycisphaerae bacterium]|nr:peptidylprolyl isomerase [Phycisphaerae bacterium]